MNEGAMRKDLVQLLKGGQAHITYEKSLSGIKPENRNIRPHKEAHSIYEELEHMRIAQEDILRYTLDENWKSPEWPDGYWPSDNDELTEKKWKKTFSGFFKDLEELIGLVKNPGFDLTAKIPHGQGRTYLREILLAADHNAYHLAKIMQIRKARGEYK